MKTKTLIIDYGTGNLLSLKRALEHVGAEVIISDNHRKIDDASHIILPGVGAFKKAVDVLKEKKLDEIIKKVVEKKRNFLGICLGMQLLLKKSYEHGVTKGLGIFDGEVKSIKTLKNSIDIKIPNIGWYNLQPEYEKKQFNIFKDLNDKDNFYFVHSFLSDVKKNNEKNFSIKYFNINIPAIISKNNIFGFQFHPEKSGKSGLKLLKNFTNLK